MLLFCAQVHLLAQSFPPHSKGEVISHKYFSLAYSEQHEQAMWVYYVLTPSMVGGSTKRTDDFREDSKVSTGSATLADYRSSGYDRGHLCPAASMSHSSTAMSETFYMSNMSPQEPSFNRGSWRNLESAVRNFLDNDRLLHIATGPIFQGNRGHIGSSMVTIPSHYYKVIYSPQSEKMIAFVMPNQKNDSPLTAYSVSVDRVEELTGIDFFYQLDDDIQDDLEASVDLRMWNIDTSSKQKSSTSKSTAVQCLGIASSTGNRCRTRTTKENGYCHHHQSQAKDS